MQESVVEVIKNNSQRQRALHFLRVRNRYPLSKRAWQSTKKIMHQGFIILCTWRVYSRRLTFPNNVQLRCSPVRTRQRNRSPFFLLFFTVLYDKMCEYYKKIVLQQRKTSAKKKLKNKQKTKTKQNIDSRLKQQK